MIAIQLDFIKSSKSTIVAALKEYDLKIKQVIKSGWGKSTADGVDEEGDLFANLITNDDQAVEMMEEYIKDGHNFDKF